MQATEVVSAHRTSHGDVAQVATSDPAGRRLEVRIEAAGDGALFMRAKITGDADQTDVDAMRIGFASPSSERFFGFGERSDAVEPARPGHRELRLRRAVAGRRLRRRRGDRAAAGLPHARRRDVLPGPVAALEPRLRRPDRPRRDVDVPPRDRPEERVERRGASRTRSRCAIFGGPTPAAGAARGSRPRPGASRRPVQPWQFGPWFQTGQPNTVPLADEAAYLAKLRKADAPVSAAETQLRYLPCGLDRGNEDYEAARVKFFHDARAGDPHLRQPDALRVLRAAVRTRRSPPARCRRPTPARSPTFDSFVGRHRTRRASRSSRSRSSTSRSDAGMRRLRRRAQADAGRRPRRLDGGLRRVHAVRCDRRRRHRAAGDAQPLPDHATTAASQSLVRRKPVVRFQRSGWTGAARCAQDVWGGDPTTTFGLRRAQLGGQAGAQHRHVGRQPLGLGHRRLRHLPATTRS